MGGQVLDYEAKRIKNAVEVEAVVNMLELGISETEVKKRYPEQFDAGKKLFEEQLKNG